MNLKSYTSPSTSIIDECSKIAETCEKYDKCKHPFFIDDDLNNSTLPIFYCAWEDNTILGFISTYIIDSETVEICEFVLPEYRRQHIASSLFDYFLCDYEDFYIQTCVNKVNETGKRFLDSLECEHYSTECKMLLNKSNDTDLTSNISLLTIKTNYPENCNTDNSISYDAYLSDVQIGTCMVFISGKTAVIHDVEIFEAYRRKGYAYELLSQVMLNIFESCDSVILHVTKENIPAYELYLKLGFGTVEEMEYYSA